MRDKKTLEMKFPAETEMKDVIADTVMSYCEMIRMPKERAANTRTAVSEAVENAILFAYPVKKEEDSVSVKFQLLGQSTLKIVVKDKGVGIENIDKARAPLSTTDESGSRSGMGFTIMESFADAVDVKSKHGEGTVVTLKIRFRPGPPWPKNEGDGIDAACD